MTASGLVIAQSIQNLVQGIALLIGILVGLLFCGTGLVVFSISVRIWLFHRRQRLAREEYLRRTRRADGKMYPPHGIGICEHCAKVRKFVYYVPSGEQLCPTCYEAWWPIAEANARKEAAERGPVADHTAAMPQPQACDKWWP